jgi:hypothetical protein
MSAERITVLDSTPLTEADPSACRKHVSTALKFCAALLNVSTAKKMLVALVFASSFSISVNDINRLHGGDSFLRN